MTEDCVSAVLMHVDFPLTTGELGRAELGFRKIIRAAAWRTSWRGRDKGRDFREGC